MPCASWELRVACNRIEIPVAILIRREARREVPKVYRFNKAISIGCLLIREGSQKKPVKSMVFYQTSLRYANLLFGLFYENDLIFMFFCHY